MPDAYLPPLADFALEPEEKAAIASALDSDDPWGFASTDPAEADALKSAKGKILNYHLQRHHGQCCYCRGNLHGAGPYMTDREHILPKGKAKFKPYSYTLWNLAAACKRCNMQFKGQSEAFLVDSADAAKFEDGANYLFVHPNFDRWEDFLERVEVAKGGKRIVGFALVSNDPKASYTHAFFNLKELVMNTFDNMQGAPTQAETNELGKLVLDLAELYRQRAG